MPLLTAMREPARVTDIAVPERPAVDFAGFSREAFETLERLRAHPHIDQYRKEKEGVRNHLKEPFKVYRDDLVVNFVLPNRLNLETERNVFSRLLKNDFGAGGCHHHFWLSFYRPGRMRLTDIQLIHSLHPEGLRIAVIARRHAKNAHRAAVKHIASRPKAFLETINPLLDPKAYSLVCSPRRGDRMTYTSPLDQVPEGLPEADSFAIGRVLPAEHVVRREGRILEDALNCIADLWPAYRFLLT